MSTASDIEARASEWLARKDRDEWSSADQAALDDWLSQSTAHRVAYLRLEHVWTRADCLSNEETHPAPVSPIRSWAWPSSMAASLLLMAAGAGWLVRQPPSVVHSTSTGQHEEVRLRDNSNLALNTNTRLVAVVDKGAREVWLDHGEAYFEIAHDPAHPFVVHAGKQLITVLGTKFLVRQEGDAFRVAVTEGRVRLAPAVGSVERPIVLTRGDVATASSAGLLLSTEPDTSLIDDVAWRRGTLVFSRVTLADAAEQFNRYSDRKLVIPDPAVAAIRIGGRFSTTNVEGFANLVHSSLGLNVSGSPDAIVISG